MSHNLHWTAEQLAAFENRSPASKKEQPKIKVLTKKEVKDFFSPEIIVGIDPGIKSGYAALNKSTHKLIEVQTLKLFELFEALNSCPKDRTTVYIENPNTYIPFGGKKIAAQQQGAGAVKQTFKHIIEFLEDRKLKYITTKLQGTLKKKKADWFKEQTGWEGSTNEHGRDAALLIWGR